jgi:hypothetical protein
MVYPLGKPNTLASPALRTWALSWNAASRCFVMMANQQRVNGTGMNTGSSSERASGMILALSIVGCPMMKLKKYLTADGYEIVGFTILAWLSLFALYALGHVFRLW